MRRKQVKQTHEFRKVFDNNMYFLVYTNNREQCLPCRHEGGQSEPVSTYWKRAKRSL